MTQLFLDSRVERHRARNEALSVTGIARARRLRGRAAGLRRDPREAPDQARARPSAQGRRRPHNAWPSSATRPASCRSARRSPPTPSRPATASRCRASGQGLGHRQAPGFSHGPVTRLAQRARPRLDRRRRLPRARLQGHPRPGPDGQQARHPARPRGRARGRRREPHHGPRLGPGPAQGRRGGAVRWPKAPVLGGKQQVDLDATAHASAAPRARSCAGPSTHAGRAPRRRRRAARFAAAGPSPGARRAPAAPAQVPRARRLDRRRRRLRPLAASLRSRSTARSAARRFRSASSVHAERL